MSRHGDERGIGGCLPWGSSRDGTLVSELERNTHTIFLDGGGFIFIIRINDCPIVCGLSDSHIITGGRFSRKICEANGRLSIWRDVDGRP